MAGLPKLEGLITVPTGGWTMILDDWGSGAGNDLTVTVAAGTYYLSTADTSARSFLDQCVSGLDAATGHGWTATLDDTTGKVTLNATAITTGLKWVSTGLRDALGFTTDIPTQAESFTSPSQAQYLFLPNCGRGLAYMSPDGDAGAQEADLTIAVSPSGHVRAYGYEQRYIDVLDFPQLKSSKTWISDEATPNESLQRFWQSTLRTGTRFRYHPDGTVDGTYVTWVAEAGEFKPRPLVPGWDNANALWSWGCNVRKYV